jgi:hypothetical protein
MIFVAIWSLKVVHVSTLIAYDIFSYEETPAEYLPMLFGSHSTGMFSVLLILPTPKKPLLMKNKGV